MKVRAKVILLSGAAAIAALEICAMLFFHPTIALIPPVAIKVPAQPISLPFTYAFQVDGSLEETGSLSVSSSPFWWLDSGAYLLLQHGVGRTVHGDLAEASKWRRKYGAADPDETDGGFRPQNIFRLLSRSVWQDVSAEASFKIDAYDLSQSQYRSESNGLLLFQRYADSDNLYYAGVRVDGTAVIKKKIHGDYYTLVERKVLPGAPYDRETNPDLLPIGAWMGVKVVARNVDTSRVSIKLYTDFEKKGVWTLAAEALDDGETYGGGAFTGPGHTGIRTDFMDVEFDDFRLTDPSKQ